MQYQDVIPAIFIERPNRFIAHVETEEGLLTVHVKNTGRCRELLTPGAKVYIARSRNPARRTAGDLVAVWKGDRLINMDSQAPNRVVAEALHAGLLLPGMTAPAILIRPETTWGDSRLDFYFRYPNSPTLPSPETPVLCRQGGALLPPLQPGMREGFLEVKGVTLEEGGAVYFPDAPTQRGVRHVEELIKLKAAGYDAWLLFVIQMKGAAYFAPNDRTHPDFGEALRRAQEAGVRLCAYDCLVKPGALSLLSAVEIRLDEDL